MSTPIVTALVVVGIGLAACGSKSADRGPSTGEPGAGPGEPEARADDSASADRPAAAAAGAAIDSDLRPLAESADAALPGALIRAGRHDVAHTVGEGDLVVVSWEVLALHRVDGGYIGRIDISSDSTPAPPERIVFRLDDERALVEVLWHGLPGDSSITHEDAWVWIRELGEPGGRALEVRREPTGGGAVSAVRLPLTGPWSFDGAHAMRYLPLAARPLVDEPVGAHPRWASIGLRPPETQAAAMLEVVRHRDDEVQVGDRNVAARRYEHAAIEPDSADKTPPRLWVDDQGLVIRHARRIDDELGTRWDTRYVPAPGDPLHR